MQKKHSGRQPKRDTLGDIIAYANHCKHPDGVYLKFDRNGAQEYCPLCRTWLVQKPTKSYPTVAALLVAGDL